jgi:hypothetical protein
MNRASDDAVKHFITTATPEELDALKLLIFAREHELKERRKKLQSSGFHIIKESTKSNMC